MTNTLFDVELDSGSKDSQQDQIWFGDLVDGEYKKIDEQVLMTWLNRVVFENNTLQDSVPNKLFNDSQPRIVFLSLSNGSANLQVVFGVGKGIVPACKDAFAKLSIISQKDFKPRWLKVDIVDQVVPLGDCLYSELLEHDRSSGFSIYQKQHATLDNFLNTT